MKKLFLKVLSVMLSAVCLFSCVNITAFADEASKGKVTLCAPKINAKLYNAKEPHIFISITDKSVSTNGYYVYRRSSSEKEYELLTELQFADGKNSSNSFFLHYNDYSLEENTVYYYKIKGIFYEDNKIKAESEFSNTVSCSSEINKTEVFLNDVSNGKIKLSWDEVDDASRYYIYYSTSKNGKYECADYTTKTSYTFKAPKPAQRYYFKIKSAKVSNNKVYKSIYSNVVYCCSEVNKPIVKTETTSDKIKLSWDKVDGAERYYVYYSTSKNGKYECIGYTKNTSYTFKDLKPSTRYYFKVKSAKVIAENIYKSVDSDVVSSMLPAKDKDGEYIVDFKKISNKEAGLPTGSAITCLTMVLNHYGLDLSPMEVYEYFDCSTEFYTKNGRLYGPNHRKYFIGDPTSDKAYCYGAEMVYIHEVYKKILATNKNTIKMVQYHNMDEIKKAMREGHIIFVRAVKRDPNRKYIFWLHEDGSTMMYDNQKYGILCGYTDTHYIVYDPYLDKYERYKWTLEYNVFTGFFTIGNE